jgi:glycerophosphoryl diester phosphodiesterase
VVSGRGRYHLIVCAVLSYAVMLTALTAAALVPHHSAAFALRRLPTGYPLVIGHRGAAAYVPEHTLAGYQLAIDQGVDYIEPDLVVTQDGVLVARHENELSQTTDVAAHPEFAYLRRTKMIEGHQETGWFAEDFTFAQLETLRCVSRPGGPPALGEERVPDLQQIIDLIRRQHRPVGLYVELKLATYLRAIGHPPEPLLVAVLHRNGLDRLGAKVIIESFYPDSLRVQHAALPNLADIQLLSSAPSQARLRVIRGYAVGIGVPLAAAVATVIRDAHQLGLQVHAYTFTAGSTRAEYLVYYRLGVDGVFADQPDVAIAARDGFTAGRAG